MSIKIDDDVMSLEIDGKVAATARRVPADGGKSATGRGSSTETRRSRP